MTKNYYLISLLGSCFAQCTDQYPEIPSVDNNVPALAALATAYTIKVPISLNDLYSFFVASGGQMNHAACKAKCIAETSSIAHIRS